MCQMYKSTKKGENHLVNAAASTDRKRKWIHCCFRLLLLEQTGTNKKKFMTNI